jgi:hypothetical protein
MHRGRDYDPRFGARMRGEGVWADLLTQRFHKACARLGLNQQRVELDLTQFKRPQHSRKDGQAELFSREPIARMNGPKVRIRLVAVDRARSRRRGRRLRSAHSCSRRLRPRYRLVWSCSGRQGTTSPAKPCPGMALLAPCSRRRGELNDCNGPGRANRPNQANGRPRTDC